MGTRARVTIKDKNRDSNRDRIKIVLVYLMLVKFNPFVCVIYLIQTWARVRVRIRD